jgi:outer membrane protein assembly factor BamD (BamD/ComL family)
MAQQKNAWAKAGERFEQTLGAQSKWSWKPWKQAMTTAAWANENISLTQQAQAHFDEYIRENQSPYGCDTNEAIVQYFTNHSIDLRQIPAFIQLLPWFIAKWELENPEEY